MSESPEEIARKIFAADAQHPLTYSIIASGEENTDYYYVFEILYTILFEGFDILVKGLDKVNPDNIEIDHFKQINPWFHSIGFNINVEECIKSDNSYENYYCKTIIKDSSYKFFFKQKNISKNYHFFLSYKLTNSQHSTNLEEIYGIFIGKDKVFKISFSEYSGN